MEPIDQETHVKRIKAITDISRAVVTDQPLDDILNRIVLITARVMDYEVCSIWLVDDSVTPRKLRLKATQALDSEYARPRTLGRVEGVAGFVATHNQPLRILDVLKEPRYKEKDMARKLGLVSMLSVPFSVADDDVIGVLNAFTNHPREFPEEEVLMAKAVGNLTAFAIRNATLLNRLQSLEDELETRKVVERAKEVLIRRRSLSGEEAFRWIQKRSMNSRKTMRQIAEAVLISEDV